MGEETAASHAGVEGEVGFDGRGYSKTVKVGYFLVGAEAGNPATSGDFLALSREGCSEDEGTGFDAGFEEVAGFSGIGDAEKREVFLVEDAGDCQQPVPIGSTLDDSHDLLA